MGRFLHVTLLVFVLAALPTIAKAQAPDPASLSETELLGGGGRRSAQWSPAAGPGAEGFRRAP